MSDVLIDEREDDVRRNPLSPQSGTVRPLPSVQIPLADYFDQRRGVGFTAPAGISPREIESSAAVSIDGRDSEEYVGAYNFADTLSGMAEAAGQAPRGLGRFFGELPDVLRQSRIERAERFIEASEEDYSPLDIIKSFNPFAGDAEKTAAQNRVMRNLFGMDAPDLSHIQEFIDEQQSAIEDNRRFLADIGLERPEYGWGRKLFFDLGHGTGSIGLAIGTTVVTRNPALAAVVFAKIQKSSAYEEARAAGFSPKAAGQISTLAGLTEGALEAVGNAVFLRLARADGPLRRIIGRAMEESLQEGVQQAAEAAIMNATGVREDTAKDVLSDVAYASAIGAIVGAPAAGVVELAQKAGRASGLPDNMTRQIADTVIAARGGLQAEAGRMVEDAQSAIHYNEKSGRQVKDIVGRFLAGEDVDIESVTGKAPPTIKAALDRLISERSAPIDTSDTIIAGRARHLEGRMDAMDLQIDAMSDHMDALGEGAEARAMERRIARLERARTKVEDELVGLAAPATRAGLLPDENATLDRLRAEGIGRKDITISAGEIRRLAKAGAAEAVKGIRQAFREGRRLARQDVKAAQSAIASLVVSSGMRPADKAKFIRTIGTVQTQEQFARAVPRIRARMISLMEEDRARTAKQALGKTLKATKVRKQSGKPVGKLTPETQQRLDTLRAIWSMKKSAAAERLAASLTHEQPSPDNALENRLMAIVAGAENVTAADIEAAVADIGDIVAEGREGGIARLAARRDRKADIIERASAAVMRGERIEEINTTSLASRIAASLRSGRGVLSSMWNGWNEVIDIVFNQKGVDADQLLRDLQVTREVQRAKVYMMDWHRLVLDAAMDAFDIAKPHKIVRKLAHDEKRVDLGEFTDAAGRNIRLQYSVAEARNLWMKDQDASVRDAIRAEDGNAYTQEMLDAIYGLLGEADFAFARAQLDIYQEIYPQINATYSAIYGVNLPQNQNYSPIVRDRSARPAGSLGDSVTDTNEFLHDMQYRRSIAPGALKSRVANVIPFARRSDIGNMQRHISEMSHFVALAEKVNMLNAVFGDARLRREIEVRQGRATVQYIDKFLQDLTRGYVRRAHIFDGWFNWFNRNYSQSVLALKPQIGIKQLVSFPAMAENIPTGEFIRHVMDFARHPARSMRELWGLSALLRDRGSSIDLEISRLGQINPELMNFAKTGRWSDMMMIFIRLGDRFPIYAGGWAVYKHHLSLGKSQADAIAEMERVAASTQQSSDLDQMSDLQRSSGVGRTLTMFMSAPLALLRAELRAGRQFARGKIGIAEFSKRMAIYHILIPQLFTFVANAFSWDDEDQATAAIMGSLVGFPLYADLMETIIWTLIGEKKFRMPPNIPAWEVPEQIFRGVRDMIESTTAEELIDAMKDLGSAGGKLTGLPVEQLVRAAEGAVDVLDGDAELGTLKLLGYPKSVTRDLEE